MGGLGLACMEQLRAARPPLRGHVGTARVCLGPRLCRSAGDRPCGVALAMCPCLGRRGWAPVGAGIWAESCWKQGQIEMLRGNKEASPSAQLEASIWAPSQNPSARVERNMEKSRRRDHSATDVLHDRVTSAALPASVSPTKSLGRALLAGVEEPVLPFVLLRAPVLRLHVLGGDVSLPSVCRSCAVSLCRGGEH